MVDDRKVERQNKAIVTAAFQAWQDGTGSPFDLLTPGATWKIVGTSPVSRTYTGRQEFIDNVIAHFNARMQRRLVPVVRRLFAEGDTVIALFDAEGVANDGEPYRNTYTWYMRIMNGQVVDVIAFFDTIEFTQLWTRVKPQLPNKEGTHGHGNV